MRSGIIKSTYEDTYVFPPPPEYKFLQFGGTGDDYIYDVKKLTTGEYVILVSTLSMTFAGIDISSYTDGSTYPAWGILKIDPNLPTSNFIKGYYWLSGATKTIATGTCPKIRVDDSDNIFYLYGTYTGGATTDWKVYGIRSSDMTLQYTADTAIRVYAPLYYFAIASFYLAGGNFYVVYYDDTYGIKGQKLNSSLVQTASGNIAAGRYCVSDCYVNTTNSYVFVTDDAENLYRTDLSFGSVTSVSLAAEIANQWPMITGNDSNVYIADVKHGDNDMVITAYDQATLTHLGAPWSNYVKTVASSKTTRNKGLWFDSAGKLYSLGCTDDGTTGLWDMEMIEINPANGAEVSKNWIRYNNGSVIAQATKYYQTQMTPAELDTNKFLVAGYTSGNLTGFTQLGGGVPFDCIIMKVDNTGKILA